MSAFRVAALFLLAPVVFAPEFASSEELPEFLGVYASEDGKLRELTANRGGMRGMAMGGADLVRQLSGISLRTGDVEFIVYRQDVTGYVRIPLRQIAVVRREVDRTSGASKPLEEAWYATDKGHSLRVAPIAQSPSLMIRAVPPTRLAPGLWALDLGGTLYDFSVGEDPQGHSPCLDRLIGIGGAKYVPCEPGDLAPDLIISELRVLDTSANGIDYRYTVTNIGNGAADMRSTVVQGHLVPNPESEDAEGRPAGGRVLAVSGNLQPGGSTSGEIGAGLEVNPETYPYLRLTVTVHKGPSESNEDNNTVTVPIVRD